MNLNEPLIEFQWSYEPETYTDTTTGLVYTRPKKVLEYRHRVLEELSDGYYVVSADSWTDWQQIF